MKKEPLAFRMCPQKLEDFVGQEEILGKDTLLYRMIKSGLISSLIFYGPPGTGKSSIAKIIANTTKSVFRKLNAVTAGVSDIKKVIEETRNHFFNPEGKTVLFIDEIHRFNKAQQDALLPFVEDGTIVLIGATTENPFFEVNKALISRSTVFMLKPLSSSDIKKIINTAISDKERGLGEYLLEISEDALDFIADCSSGDARVALNALELAVKTTQPDFTGKIEITIDIAASSIQKKVLNYDKNSDNHYDTISAFIKSMRGSNPDATVFYLARALYAGEEPEFLARRIIICASEDVGLANPTALTLAVSAFNAVKMIGMPEARIILSQAAIMVATSPKSNAAYVAINNALKDVEKGNTGDVPLHLRNAVTKELKEYGYGVEYKYPHDFPGNFIEQEYMPNCMKNTRYYFPTQNGYENKLNHKKTNDC
jgi:putative ATPase